MVQVLLIRVVALGSETPHEQTNLPGLCTCRFHSHRSAFASTCSKHRHDLHDCTDFQSKHLHNARARWALKRQHMHGYTIYLRSVGALASLAMAWEYWELLPGRIRTWSCFQGESGLAAAFRADPNRELFPRRIRTGSYFQGGSGLETTSKADPDLSGLGTAFRSCLWGPQGNRGAWAT